MTVASRGDDALALALSEDFGLVVLDRMLPGLDGIAVLEALRAAKPELGVIMLTARVTTGGTATVLESRHQHSLVFTASRLRALPAGRNYELWLMGPGRARSAGLLPRPRAGMIGPMVISGLVAGERIGLTVEPAGGSARRLTYHPGRDAAVG